MLLATRWSHHAGKRHPAAADPNCPTAPSERDFEDRLGIFASAEVVANSASGGMTSANTKIV